MRTERHIGARPSAGSDVPVAGSGARFSEASNLDLPEGELELIVSSTWSTGVYRRWPMAVLANGRGSPL